MVVLLIGIFIAVSVAVVLEVRELLDAINNAKHTAQILRKLPRNDPPDDSKEFYDVQVSRNTMHARLQPDS